MGRRRQNRTLLLHRRIAYIYCDTLNADVAFSPNAISNVKYIYMYNDWLSNIDESVIANVNLIKELIDVTNEVKWVHIFDMQNIMCIIHELCVAWCRLQV